MPFDPRLDADIARFAEELPAAIWVGVVPSGECVYVNREFQDILGFAPPPEATRGEYATSYGVFTRDGRPYPEDQMPYERALRARGRVVVDDLVVRRGPRPYTYLRVFAKPLFDDAGNITHVVEAFVDISREVAAETARAEIETQLRHAQKMESLGNLAGGIAHDFNNMLGAMKLLGSQLAAMKLDPAAAAVLGQMNDVTESASRLTRSLLGFAQRTRSVQSPLEMNQVVEAIASLARRTIDRRIELRVEATAEPTVVIADESQLEQVLFNLVLNARDAISGNGTITIRTRVEEFTEPAPCGAELLAPGRYVVVEVIDTGTGMTAKTRDRVFEPYFTTKTGGATRGTGLGLATAFGIVKRHRGGIAVVASDSNGTTMRMLVPASDELATRDSRTSAVPSPVTRAEGSLLLVDDDPIVRQASAAALAGLGYDVATANDGYEAVAYFEKHHAELVAVVLDLVMPLMSGREALEAMRTIDPSVPVIIATGSLLDDRDRASLGTIAGLLPKPYGPRELTTAVSRGIRSAQQSGA